MNFDRTRTPPPLPRVIADRAFAAIEHFLHIEATSGIVLLIAACASLVLANSPIAQSYDHFWHTPVTIGFGDATYSRSLHFWINDGLMTVFFLVVGMEIRSEIHDGALNNVRTAALPFAAAVGGVVVPALIFLALNQHPAQQTGWAIPTATDIAFAVGVLALLGPSVPRDVRILLLALAIIDDILAVLIIALFYSAGLDYSGFVIVGIGVLIVLTFQRMGIGSAWSYVIPGAIIWIGVLVTGAHPTLAGVILGLITPVFSVRADKNPHEAVAEAFDDLTRLDDDAHPKQLARALKDLSLAQRELIPPVRRVQMLLHPWVAFGVMPLFALANAGVDLRGINLSVGSSLTIMLGTTIALLVGKPLGIIGAAWTVVRLGWCQLPPTVSWAGVCLVGLLGGIGFTMSIFIAMLAFSNADFLNAAKLGVLLASFIAGLLGFGWGSIFFRSRSKDAIG